MKKELGSEGGHREAARRAARIKRLEELIFRAAERSPFFWETLMASICELKEYLRKEAASGAKGIEDDVDAILKAYGKLSKACAKFVPVLGRAKASLGATALSTEAKRSA